MCSKQGGDHSKSNTGTTSEQYQVIGSKHFLSHFPLDFKKNHSICQCTDNSQRCVRHFLRLSGFDREKLDIQAMRKYYSSESQIHQTKATKR